MRRRLRGAALGLLAGAACLALAPREAHAYSQSRLLIHRAALAEGGAGFAGPGGDVRMVAAVFERAGVAAALAERLAAGGEDAFMGALCAPDAPPSGAVPEPGDLLEYVAGGGKRLAVAVTEAEVLLLEDDGRAGVERLRTLTGDDRVHGAVPRAGLLMGWCRLSTAAVPDAGDLSTPPGRVALGDVGSALAHLDDLAAHPRDADTGWTHRLTTSFWQVVGRVLRGGSQLIGLIGGSWAAALDWLHDHLGVAFYATPFLIPWLGVKVMRATVDLRGLHAVLVWLGVGGLLLALGPPLMLTLGLFAAPGWLAGWWSPRRLGTLVAAALWSASVFGIDTLTGIDGTRPSSIAMVAFALGTDVLLFAKPLGVAVRVAEVAERWRWLQQPLELATSAGEASAQGLVRATAPVDAAKGLFTLQISDLARVALPQRRVPLALARMTDLLTAPWRGPATAPGPVIDVATAVGGWGAKQAGLRLAEEQASRQLIMQAVIPGLRSVADTYQVHGAARSVIAAVNGQGPQVWQPSASPPPEDGWVRRAEAAVERRG